MKFIIKKNELLKILKFNEKIIESKNFNNPVLNNINLIINKNGSKCICSNGIISGCYEINNDEIKIEENGKILIKNKLLVEIISKLNDEEISFHKIENSIILIKTKNFSSELKVIEDESFPKIDFSFDSLPCIKIPNNHLNEILRKNGSCVLNDLNKTKPMSGVYFDTKINDSKLTTLSTDTFKLAYLTSEIQDELKTNFILNTSTLNVLTQIFKQNNKYISFFIDESKKRILIKEENITIIDNSITGEFPTEIFIKAFNINEKTKIRVNKQELTNSLELCKTAVVSEKNPVVIFNIKNGEIELQTSSFEIGNIKTNLNVVNFSGENVKFGVNITFLLSLLKNIDDENVNLSIDQSEKPILIKGESTNFKELILPVIISNQ